MSKFLAIGYIALVLVLAAAIGLGRGLVPQLDGITSLYVALCVGLLLLPAGLLLVWGAKASIGRLRKALGFSMGILSVVTGLGAGVLLIVFLLGGAM